MLVPKVSASEDRRISITGGDVRKVISKSDLHFFGFGELYVSYIKQKVVKGWKRHREMVMNLFVPAGSVEFAFYDQNLRLLNEVLVSESNCLRVTVQPSVWFAFRGVSPGESVVVNLASIAHTDAEVDRLPLDFIKHDWREL